VPDLSGAADLSRRRVVVSSARASEAAAAAPEVMDAARQEGRDHVSVQTDQFGRRAVTVEVEGEPRYLTPELQQQASELAALRQHVRQRAERLAGLGGGVGGGLSYPAMLDLRLRLLLDTLWPPDTRRGQRARLDFETRFENTVADALDRMEVVIRQQQLAANVELDPEVVEWLASKLGVGAPAAEQARRNAQES
jgi:hypothetical protein